MSEEQLTAEPKSAIEDKKSELENILEGGPYAIDVDLPSRGRFYGDAMPGGKVRIRPISVKEEKIFTSSRNQMDVADDVLRKCIVGKCIPLRDMLMTDKFYLLLNLRAISYGSDYSFRLKCSSCANEFVHKVVLPTGLRLKVATEADVEPFELKLPVSGKSLGLRFLRGSDEKEIINYVRQLPATDADDGDPGYVYRLSRFIATIDGEDVPSIEKMKFVEEMIGKDSFALRQAMVEHECGAELSLTVTCSVCRQQMATSLPLTDEFFPSSVS